MTIRVVSERFTFNSATDTGTLQGRLYLPCREDTGEKDIAVLPVRCLVQIVHGMAEHMERYHLFASWLTVQGCAVCIFDLPGHGSSAASQENLGFFAYPDGHKKVLEDVARAADLCFNRLRQLLPKQKKPPYIIFGHSMGSFIARLYSTRPAHPLAGAVYCGTSGRNPAALLGQLLARGTILLRGPRHRALRLASITAAGNLKRIDHARTPWDWLSRDPAVVEAYIADPLCGFPFTASGYLDLFTWLRQVTGRDWQQQLTAHLPILLLYGGQDPVGQYGKGPKQLSRSLASAGHPVTLKGYPDSRHEVLNELNCQDVWHDVASWIQSITADAGSQQKSEGGR
ncbi:MAG: alpha/beta hydrolase [Ruminococcaceae bacterium]|nr:alpha/beta hydrolase [Oscillospiraceae bacterium]